MDERLRPLTEPAARRRHFSSDLRRLGSRRKKLRAAQARNQAAINLRLPLAYDAGASVIRLARITGMSRRAVYDVLEKKPPGPL
jgi:hypothetical protein